ncbi:MAG: aminomethyl-transferring glycine dehydrogenase subunit GcvPB, partial [Candidatus Cloacimonadota bacterium]
MKLIFEKSVKGRDGYSLPVDLLDEVDIKDCIPDYATIATRKALSEVSEVDVVRHFTKLSKFNHGIDDGLYPLGSCTMKYNPKVNEKLSSFDNFVYAHPLAPEETVQGCLEIMHDLNELFCEITGVDQYT